MFAVAALGAFGCELITTIDRSLIDSGTSTGTGTGGAGGGPMAECAVANDCPDPGSECITRTCEAGKCGTTMVAVGTAVAAQVAGDCKVQQCDGAGKSVSANDDLDVPKDTNPCTDDVCTAGVPSNNAAASGTACGANLICDGAGKCVGCATAADCPGATDECEAPSCTAGVCGMTFTAAGTAVTMQTAGDCKTAQCDGNGAVVTVPSNTDLPVDGNDCTDDLCTAGVASNPPTMAGGTCATGGNTVCNGAGSCTGCVTAATCPGTDTECQTRTCTANVCGFSFAASGTATAAQTAGDCKKNTCNGAGAIVNGIDNSDVPVDSNACTSDVCTAGSPSNPPTGSGTVCAQNGGTLCNGSGTCVQCLAAATCPGVDTDCKVRTCTLGACGFANTAGGTVTSSQTTGDCKENQCDGAGNSTVVTKNTDVPADDGNQCTNEICTAGTPSHPPSASGAVCSQMGGAVCNGASVCVECVVNANCASGVCSGNVCQAATCTDGVKNGTETGTDCGGTCAACLGAACTIDSDCTSGGCIGNVCSLVNGCDLSTISSFGPSTVAFGGALGLTYSPACIKVHAGTMVTFNGSFAGHPLVAGEVVGGSKVPGATTGPFGAGTSTGTTATYTMSTTGTFPYYCDFHALSGMTGAVFVVP
jgi:plastocyanin